jgi:hypothetical protein
MIGSFEQEIPLWLEYLAASTKDNIQLKNDLVIIQLATLSLTSISRIVSVVRTTLAEIDVPR